MIDSFNSFRLGKLEFAEPGYYEITVEITAEHDEAIQFNWVWLESEAHNPLER